MIENLINNSQSVLKNYIVPGLESRLLGGNMRLFVNTREQFHHIAPHSHRFDFSCVVLQGHVINMIFKECPPSTCEPVTAVADLFSVSVSRYKGSPGNYEHSFARKSFWTNYKNKHVAGDVYMMSHDQVHSIIFSRDAVVLFIEGEEVCDSSLVLEPSDGGYINTFKVEPWMFMRADCDGKY